MSLHFLRFLCDACLLLLTIAHGASARTPSGITTQIAVAKQQQSQARKKAKHFKDLLEKLNELESETRSKDQKDNFLTRLKNFKYMQ